MHSHTNSGADTLAHTPARGIGGVLVALEARERAAELVLVLERARVGADGHQAPLEPLHLYVAAGPRALLVSENVNSSAVACIRRSTKCFSR